MFVFAISVVELSGSSGLAWVELGCSVWVAQKEDGWNAPRAVGSGHPGHPYYGRGLVLDSSSQRRGGAGR